MKWQTEEGKKKATIEASMIEELSGYLQEKEQLTGAQLVGALSTRESMPDLVDHQDLSLSRAMEAFEKKVQLSLKYGDQMRQQDHVELCQEVNKALWHYVEVLEECSNEFFQQMDLMGFEQWNDQVFQNGAAIKELIDLRCTALLTHLPRIEHALELHQKGVVQFTHSLIKRWASHFTRSPLDPSLEATLEKCQKFLNYRFQRYIDEYRGFSELHENITESQSQFYNFPAFLSLDLDTQAKYKRLDYLLKVWEQNRHNKTLPSSGPIKALRMAGTPEYVAELFHEYFLQIKKSIFSKSRLIKEKEKIPDEVGQLLANYKQELNLLRGNISTYGKFNALNDRWRRRDRGFSDTKAGKMLRQQIEACDLLSQDCTHFLTTLETLPDREVTVQQIGKINRCLHEMGQPLASAEWMKKHAKTLLKSLQQIDELSERDPEVVGYMGMTLCKALQEDWRYHVLLDLPQFAQVYEMHKNIVEPVSSRTHAKRLLSLHRVLAELQEWVKSGESVRHMREVKLDIADIKNYLQSFYAEIQQVKQEKDEEENSKNLGAFRESLLDYLYLFADFFHKLPEGQPEGQIIRQQLLFVQQYFDAISNKLQELYLGLGGSAP